MATTLERLVLAQLVYLDMRDFYPGKPLIADENNQLLKEKVLDKLNKNDGTPAITMNDLKSVLSNWQLVDAVNLEKDKAAYPEEQENGFYSAMFKNISSDGSGELVYAIRGSDPGLSEILPDVEGWVQDWIGTNLGELPLNATNQNAYSRKIQAEYYLTQFLRKDKNLDNTQIPYNYISQGDLSITGHSMGGALAQRLAVDLYGETGKAFVTETFNAPGQLHGLTDDEKVLNAQGVYQIINYVNQDDLTGTLDLLPSEGIPAAAAMEAALTIAAYMSGNPALIGAVGAFLNSEAGRSLNAMIAQNLSNPEYAAQFMKHVGKTQYMPGEASSTTTIPLDLLNGSEHTQVTVTSDSHALMNFFQYIRSNGDLVPNKGATISLDDGKDMVIGTNLADTVDLGGGNDWIRAGKGNDTITGGFGNDTYIYRSGDGSDTIHDYHESNFGLIGDAGTEDTLVLENIKMNQVRAARSGNNLVLLFANGQAQDSITIANYYAMTNGGTPIERIKFSDGAVVDLKDWLIEGTEGSDTSLAGNSLGNLIYGHGGSDEIHAHLGSDIIYGGAGVDTIYAGEGNNIVEGGAGNDTIDAGRNSDIFVFSVGDGQDTITDWGGYDSLIINGVDSECISVTAGGSGDLVISFGTDQITLTDFYRVTGMEVSCSLIKGQEPLRRFMFAQEAACPS